MIQLKGYQETALTRFEQWQNALAEARQETEEDKAVFVERGRSIPAALENYPRMAWESMRQAGRLPSSAGDYVPRTDAAGRPIPHACFKVPTGGGKTLLAAAALTRLAMQTGLVLWVVPTKAIYQQTKEALQNREHPYREMLETASGGRVKLLEMGNLPRFGKSDVSKYLCVMLVMFPAANRNSNRDFLRMFRDSDNHPSLFPYSDDILAEQRLLDAYPDLERAGDDGPVKRSLFNAFKILRPVVILDEAHKAYGKKQADNEEFVQSVNRLDPSMVIELSATPHPGISNLLVDIGGQELKCEEMIKLPIRVTTQTGEVEWQETLTRAHEKLQAVAREAESYAENGGRYIRPIAVVRVERTGKDQRDGERIHAEDVREFLTRNLAVPENAVAVKSATQDELGREDLLSPQSPITWIITRAALMEGWDCSFAYMLVMLDNTHSQKALTQLVGRVMRQPYASRTEREALDQCYVYCWKMGVHDAVQQVRRGLDDQGLTGLGGDVFDTEQARKHRKVERRDKFRGQDFFLPRVLHRTPTGEWAELDYQAHILPLLDWRTITAFDPQGMQYSPPIQQTASVDVVDALQRIGTPEALAVDKTLSLAWFARHLTNDVPNAWQAARIAQEMIDRLRENLSDDEIFDRRTDYALQLRRHVIDEADAQAERVFRSKLDDGIIRFDLEAGKPMYRVLDYQELLVPEFPSPLTDDQGHQLELSLFAPVLQDQFDSDLERRFARYLDGQKALTWWHRVAARQRGDYYVRGWRQNRIWPDFVAVGGDSPGNSHVLILETKGERFEDIDDTDYKKKVFAALEQAFNSPANHGTLTINDGPAKGTFRILFNESQFAPALARLNGAYASATL